MQERNQFLTQEIQGLREQLESEQKSRKRAEEEVEKLKDLIQELQAYNGNLELQLEDRKGRSDCFRARTLSCTQVLASIFPVIEHLESELDGLLDELNSKTS